MCTLIYVDEARQPFETSPDTAEFRLFQIVVNCLKFTCKLVVLGLVNRLSRGSVSDAQAEKFTDKHIAIICSELDIKCVSLPSQHVRFKEKVAESSRLLNAKAITIKGINSIVLLFNV